MVARGGFAGDQSSLRAGQRIGYRATLVSIHGAGRSAGTRRRQDQRYPPVPVSGPHSAAQDEAGAASERALRRVVRGRVRRTALRLDKHRPWGIAKASTYPLTSRSVGNACGQEGAAEKNPMVRRGYSRDHRPDCEQLVIALIVNSEGFPFSYETFDGNRADVSTMETILRMVVALGRRQTVSLSPDKQTHAYSPVVNMARRAGSGCLTAAS